MAINTDSEWLELGGAPSTPATGRWKIYPKSDGFYFIDDAGTEYKIAAAAQVKYEPLFASVTPVANTGTGEDQLIAYDMPPDTLTTNLDRIEIEASGTFAATMNDKRLRLYLENTLIFDSGTLSISAAAVWALRSVVIREGETAQKAYTLFTSDEATFLAFAYRADGTEDFTTELTVRATGEATGNSDIVQETMTVTLVRAP